MCQGQPNRIPKMWVLLCNIKQWTRTTTPVFRCRESNAFDTSAVCLSIPQHGFNDMSVLATVECTVTWRAAWAAQRLTHSWLSRLASQGPGRYSHPRTRAGSGSYVEKQVSSISSRRRPFGKHKNVYNYRQWVSEGLHCAFTVEMEILEDAGRFASFLKSILVCKLPQVHTSLIPFLFIIAL